MEHFYQIFEERFRGSRENIIARLSFYLVFLEAIKKHYASVSVIDIGCGRGEWLELLSKSNFMSKGIDINKKKLDACMALNLNVEFSDALEFLKNRPDCSESVISGFHIAEHLSFEYLYNLIEETYRVLQPGGLLILETPNPENIVVGSSSFYLDPTHQRPIPPALLSFISEYVGFKQIKIFRLQEQPDLLIKPNPSLFDVLNGVSPDYAIIAQKDGSSILMNSIRNLFDKNSGISLEDISNRYQYHLNSQTILKKNFASLLEKSIQQDINRAIELEKKWIKAEKRNSRLEKKILSLNQELKAVHHANHNHWLLAELYQKRNQELLTSSSWLITKPLRKISLANKTLKHQIKTHYNWFILNNLQHPKEGKKLRQKIVKLLDNSPKLKIFIKKIVAKFRTNPKTCLRPSRVSPRTQKVYLDLQKFANGKNALD